MTLTPHAIVGAAIASTIPDQPLLGFSLAFLSHFVLDAIPHWDYKLSSMTEDKANKINNNMKIGRDFYFDLLKIGPDFSLGLILAYLLFANLVGALGAVFPDLLQFV